MKLVETFIICLAIFVDVKRFLYCRILCLEVITKSILERPRRRTWRSRKKIPQNYLVLSVFT